MNGTANPLEQKIGQFWHTGLKPLNYSIEKCSVYQSIERIQTSEDVIEAIAQLHHSGCFVLFQPIIKCGTVEKLAFKQGHFALPQRAFYLDPTYDHSKYQEYIHKCLDIANGREISDFESLLLEIV